METTSSSRLIETNYSSHGVSSGLDLGHADVPRKGGVNFPPYTVL